MNASFRDRSSKLCLVVCTDSAAEGRLFEAIAKKYPGALYTCTAVTGLYSLELPVAEPESLSESLLGTLV